MVPVRRSRPGDWLSGLLVVAALALLLAACGGQQTTQQPPPVAPPLPPLGGLPPAAAGLQPTGQLAGNTLLHLRIGLLTNRQALENDLAAIYDPNSSHYGHYLTPQQVADRYGASGDTIDTVTSYLQAQGFQILSTSPLRDTITVSASAAQIARTFQITLLTFQQHGRTFFGPSSTVTLPAALKGLVASVGGLNNFAQMTKRQQSAQANAHEIPAQKPAVDCSGMNVGITINQVAAIYHYTAAYQAGYTGKGISIGVVEFDDSALLMNDLTAFVACMTHGQLHYSVTKVDGGADGNGNDGLLEAEMDIEYLQALAPDAQIIEYQGNQSMYDVLHQIAAEDRVQVVSQSWAFDAEDGLTPNDIDAFDQVIKRMAAEGITFAEDTGDCAAYGTMQYGKLGVAFPDSDPYTLAVGGTVLQLNSKGERSSEPAWNTYAQAPDKTQCQYNDWGTGGGVSALIKQPTWQQGTGVKNQYSNGHRELPDVSAVAWNLSEYEKGKWDPYGGGTSSATPIWAAGIALVDQGLHQHHKHLVGAVPTFYQVANHPGKYHPYFDVTQGNNLYYPATTGYDLATGWGAPNLLDFGNVLGAF